MKRKKKNIWLEVGLAVVLAVALGILGSQMGEKEQEKVKKAEAENQAESEELSKNGTEASENQPKDAEKEAAKQGENSEKKEEEHQPEPTEETIAEGQYPILGKSSVTVEQMVSYFRSSGAAYPGEALSQGGADSIEVFCQMYYDEAVAEGVRPEVAFAQTMKETGWLQYEGDASIEQYNFAGLGTTGNGVPGNSYPDVRTGIRAQIQHLKAYATADVLAQECVDDRYEYVIKGSAPYVEWLGKNENPEGQGWATAENYGNSIVEMIRSMRQM